MGMRDSCAEWPADGDPANGGSKKGEWKTRKTAESGRAVELFEMGDKRCF